MRPFNDQPVRRPIGFFFLAFTRRSYTQSHDRTLGLRVTGGLDTNAVWVDAVNGDSKFALCALFGERVVRLPGIRCRESCKRCLRRCLPCCSAGHLTRKSSPIGDSAGPPAAKAIA